MTLMDGGTVWNTNLASAVNRCMEVVDDESQIILDIVLCGGSHLQTAKETGNAIENFLRYREISGYYDSMNDVVEFKKLKPNVNYRYLFIPSKPLAAGLESLIFDNSTMFPMAQVGMEDAERVINMGEGTSFDLLEEFVENEEIRKEHKWFEKYLYSFNL